MKNYEKSTLGLVKLNGNQKHDFKSLLNSLWKLFCAFLYLIARLRSTASFSRFSSFNISLAGCLTFCAAKCILVNDEDVLIQI